MAHAVVGDGLSASRTVVIDRYAIGLGGSPQHEGDRGFFGWDLRLADLDTDGRDEPLIATFGFDNPRNVRSGRQGRASSCWSSAARCGRWPRPRL